MTELIVAGLNHRTAPVEVRERSHVQGADLEEAIASLRSLPGVEGATILSTCNRVEAIVSAASSVVGTALTDWFASRMSMPADALRSHLYVHQGDAAIGHLFRVASGLDSMVIGEPQIGGQVRCAFQTARKLGSFDRSLQQVFEHTLRVAKRVRSETGIGLHPVSIPHAAVELARKIFGDLSSLRVLLLGAGNMAEVAAEHLHKQRVEHVIVANRSHEQAVHLARKFEGAAVPFDAIDDHLTECDIVIASTAAPHFVITRDQIEDVMSRRRRSALFLIDLSVPRNIDPSVSDVADAYLYDIDDLKSVVDANSELRMREATIAGEIIASEVTAFRKRTTAGDAVQTIVELRERVEQIRSAEVQKCLRKMGPITVAQREAIELLSLQLTNKLIHHPIVQLREAQDEPMRMTIRKALGLGVAATS